MAVTVSADYCSKGINRLVFILDTGYVLCKIRTELLYEICNLRFQRVNTLHIGSLLLAMTHTVTAAKMRSVLSSTPAKDVATFTMNVFTDAKQVMNYKRGRNPVNRLLSCGTRTVVILNLLYSECTRTYQSPSCSSSSSSSSSSLLRI